MDKPVKQTFEAQKTNHKTPALIFFGLAIPMILMLSMTRVSHLEQSYVYSEEARIASAKEELFKIGCSVPRQQYLSLVSRLEDKNESSKVRMQDVYESGSKEHALYRAGEQISKGEKYVDSTCSQTLVEVAKLKRGSPLNYVADNFFHSN